MDNPRVGASTHSLPLSEQAVATSTAQSGQLRGSPIVVTNLTAAVADAAEELSFAASERMEKSLSKRKASDGSGVDWNLYKIAQKYLNQVPDLKSTDRLNAFAQTFLQRSFTSAQQMLSHLESFSGEVSHQYVALKYAREYIQRQGNFPGLIATIDAALAQLESEKGPQIRAGLNVSKTAHEFKELGSTQSLRDQYRDNVLDFSGVRNAAKYLLRQFGQAKLGVAIRFLEQGLAADLNSQSSSLPKSQLAAIAQDLGVLRKLRSALSLSDSLFEKLKRNRKQRKSEASKGQRQHPDEDETTGNHA